MEASVRTVETIQTIFISGIDPSRTNSTHNQIPNQYRTYLLLFYLQEHNLKGFKIQFINPGSFQGPQHRTNYFTFWRKLGASCIQTD
jgi:peptide methionine sulfoxide reductase MsrA